MYFHLKKIWLLLFISSLIVLFWMHPRLPPVVVSHFDSSGRPNGWMSQSFFLKFNLGLVLFVNGIYFVLYSTIHKLPRNLVNITHRDYWFSTEERAQEAYQRLRTVLAMTGAFTNSVFLMVYHIIFQENGGPVLFHTSVNLLVGIILLATVGFLIAVFRITQPSRSL